DAINVAFIGTAEDLHRALIAAAWYPADPITLRSSARIVADSVFHRPYDDAPVSDLFVWGKKQDLAFEQPMGGDPRKRHHVRFWRSEQVDDQGRPLWLGAATFDTKAGLSHLTGQVTHHIDANIDKERDKLVADLQKYSGVQVDWTDPFQDAKTGKNGGGDPYFTDGRLPVLSIVKQ
ncbi:MAG TPA: LssY C-terminal domain-containing protein, partial [Burkholderiaceae bacterium]|nr:LssY C-terminal domain-containing protein [Burkholderiaceae bacterium]